jgi:hypothetical protein
MSRVFAEFTEQEFQHKRDQNAEHDIELEHACQPSAADTR